MTINEYELVLILRPDLDEAVSNEILEKLEAIVTDNEGTLLVRDDWGVRKLAYEIERHQKGRYVLEKFLANPALILEIERRIRIEERILRFLTVRKSGVVDIEARLLEATEERTRLADEAARRAAEQEAQAQYERDAQAAREASARYSDNESAKASDSDDNTSDDAADAATA